MVRNRREGELAFVPVLLVGGVVGNVGQHGGRHGVGLELAAGQEEPQFVADDPAADGLLVDASNLVFRLRRELVLAVPALIGEGVADAAVELVATRFRHRIDDAAGEAAVLGRNARGRGRRLLDGVLDEERIRLATQVVVHVHAVDRVGVLPRLCTGDRDGPCRAGRRSARRERDGRELGASTRQLFEDALRNGRGVGVVLRDQGDGLAGDLDRLGDRGERHVDVELQRLRRGEPGRPALRLETIHGVGRGVLARRQAGKNVVAVQIGHRRPYALERRRGNLDRDSRHAVAFGVGDAAREAARGNALSDGDARSDEREEQGESDCFHESLHRSSSLVVAFEHPRAPRLFDCTALSRDRCQLRDRAQKPRFDTRRIRKRMRSEAKEGGDRIEGVLQRDEFNSTTLNEIAETKSNRRAASAR